MNRESRPHVLDINSTRHIRSRSSTSSFDYRQSPNGSTYSSSVLSLLLEASPEPAFIAPAAATQIVTNNHGSFLHNQYADTPTIPVTAPALRLLNQFLDYLLYSFLATAKSTSLSVLRIAVTTVLNKRLARVAILGADEELQSYLGGTEGDEADGSGQYESESGDWDLERIWRTARVRCMVYSSLGDLEEDDEAMHVPGGYVDGMVGNRQHNQNNGSQDIVSPPVAIWLTSILEFVGEQTLLIAGHATIVRYSALCAAASAMGENSSKSRVPERPMVEELDTEKVALNPSLGRLWRQWRKHLRGTALSISLSHSDNMSHHWSSRPSTSKSLSGIDWTDAMGAAARSLPMLSYSEQSGASPGPEGAAACPSPRSLEKSLPDLMEDQLVEGKIEEDVDVKNPLTPVWETGSSMEGPAGGETTGFEDDHTDIESWLARYDDGRRPRSMILFPWTVSHFDLPTDPMFVKRPRSLPPLDAPLEFIEHVEDPIVPDNNLVDNGTDSSLDIHRPDDARPKIDKLMDRINMITSEQAELKKQLAADKDFHCQVLAPPEAIVAGALERGLTVVTSIADDVESESDAPVEIDEVIGFARASNYVKAVSPKEIQCITLTPVAGRSRRRVKGKASKRSLTESNGTGSDKTLSGSLTPVDGTGQVSEAQKSNGKPPISDFRDAIDTAMVSSDDETLPAPVANSKPFKRTAPIRLAPIPSSPRPPSSSHSKNSSSSSSRQNYTESRKNSCSSSIQHTPSTPSTLSDRSGRIRTRTSSGGADDIRPSSSMSRIVPRPIHTSGSMASQNSHGLKSFMTWPVEGGKRTDGDDASSLRSERLLHRIKTRDEKERSFEELIQSGGTIVCTLTPDEIRGIEVPGPSPRYRPDDLAEYVRMAAAEGVETPRRAAVTKPAAAKVSASLARDARVDNATSSRDLALFLRSTGPPQGTGTINSPRSTTSHSTLSSPSNSKAINLMGSGSSTKSSPECGIPPASPTPTVPSVMTLQRMDTITQSSSKKRFVAREASGSTGDSTSALADFFRNTLPPIEGEEVVQHRISRSVAPFRTTMDSDQFDMASEATRKPLHDSIVESGSTATDSYQSSMTSSTGLLNNAGKRNEEFSFAKPYTQKRTSMRDGPIRTQRRVRDPYAIDDDEFDLGPDMDLIMPPPNPARQEESLADFLRNVAPPPSTHSKYEEINDTNKKMPKKNSAVNLMIRFSRGPSRKNSISSPISFEKSQPFKPMQPTQRPDTFDGSRSSSGTQTQPTRAGSGSKPRQHNTESIRRPSDLASLHTLGGVNSSQRPQQSRPKAVGEARGARITQSSGMGELAAFLRDSAPPSMGPAPERRIETREKEKEESSGISKFRSMGFRSKGKRKELS